MAKMPGSECADTPPAPPPVEAEKPKVTKNRRKNPQELLSEYWERFMSNRPAKVTSIFPPSLYTNLLPPIKAGGASSSRNAAESYEAAARQCRDKVRRIVAECHRTNEKFTDADFDIETDHRNSIGNCLQPLDRDNEDEEASYDFYGSVHRVDWIFEKPAFTVDGYNSTDIKQGSNGDCWWLAAVATLCAHKELMDKVCVARNEECGVYGFVFFRDGEWLSTVIDDNLYLTKPDFDQDSSGNDATGKRHKEYRKRYQTGSDALYFAKCADDNETWLPLLEKAYAKVHGDYSAISGGWPSEAVEDMTGGVSTTLQTSRILSKDRLWRELTDTNGNFVFAAAAMSTGWAFLRNGLALGHAYSIIRTTEEVDEQGNKIRLVLVR